MPLIGQKIETSNDNFGDMVRENCLLVDKTLMIKQFWEGKKISLIVRPRRFGKTLNLSMLQHFFAYEVDGIATQGLFDAFAIAGIDQASFLKTYQGKYPVIFISFKDIKEFAYEAAINRINVLVQELYAEHESLLSSDKLSASNKKKFSKYLEGAVNHEELQQALKFLSAVLHKAYGKKTIILIDEYDAPLTKAYEYKFLDKLSDFMRNIFSAALKGNGHLEKGLMTGILRISKDNMLSGLNNPDIYTILEKNYEHYFGFTEAEVKELIKHTNASEKLDVVKAYYNGYQIGEATLYNPWSVMNFFDKKALAPYWLLTSNDKLLKTVLLNSSNEIKKQLTDLIQGKSISGEIDVNLRYEDLMEKEQALWTLLLFGGYLKVETKKRKDSRFICQLKIPNKEVLEQYVLVFSDWLKEKMGKRYDSFLRSLTESNVEQFTEDLGEFLMSSLSFRDVMGNKKPSEHFYHGFFVGLTASLQEKYFYDSNKESGLGLYDVGLVPKSTRNQQGVVLEFKQVQSGENMKAAAKKALMQIDALHYETTFKRHNHVKKLLKVGLAFCDKSVRSAYKITDLTSKKETQIHLSQEYVHHE